MWHILGARSGNTFLIKFMTHFVAYFIAVFAAISDVKSRKISNTFLLLSFIISFPFRADDWVLGIVSPFVILVAFHILGGIGAADIKLFMVLGSLLGVRGIVILIFFSIITAGAISLVALVCKKRTIPFALPVWIAFSGMIIKRLIDEGFICNM